MSDAGVTEITEDDTLTIDWDLIRETIQQRLKLGDDWTWEHITGIEEGPGYWSLRLPNEYELAIEPGFFGYVDVAMYDRLGSLVMPRKLTLVLS